MGSEERQARRLVRGQRAMKVIVHHPRANDRAVATADAQAVGLLELASRADFVTVHVPGTPENERMVDARFRAEMRPNAYLIKRRATLPRCLQAAARPTRSTPRCTSPRRHDAFTRTIE
jgi:3-hydroxyisobutyrate dehydrogenase-like beta-hydroxyacid dehydrogenase